MESVKEISNRLLSKPLEVLDIFNNFFGEERVDMQGYPSLGAIEDAVKDIDNPSEALIREFIGDEGFILVHFPEVTITNENEYSTVIKNLWAKIEIALDGSMVNTFTLNRSEYSALHMDNNYMHSHVSYIPKNNFTQFQRPCTGTGPINHTMGSLMAEFNADLWTLFCVELDKYVTVESLAGIPYHRLQDIKPVSAGVVASTIYRNNAELFLSSSYSFYGIFPFISYLIKNKKLSFNYINGCYSIASTDVDIILELSDLYISWYNNMKDRGLVRGTLTELIQGGILLKVFLSNGQFYNDNRRETRHNTYRNYIGKPVCTFKGNPINISITGLDESPANEIFILSPSVVSFILTTILNVVNYEYGRERKEGIASSKEVRYL